MIVEALGQGAQILIFRKGGIREDGGPFKPEHNRFLLFPTRFHQQRESVIEAAQIKFEQLEHTAVSPEKVRLEYYAEVAASHQLDSFSQAEALREQHIWRDEVIARRFDWGNEKAIYVLALRVYRLALPVELTRTSAYLGCKSWVELDMDVSIDGAEPVLSENEFQTKLGQFQAALQPTLTSAT